MAETHPRLRLWLDIGAAGVAVAALGVSFVANNKSATVADENLQLAQQAAQADAGVDASLVDFADHSTELYIRNASRRPMRDVSLLRGTFEGENFASSTLKATGKVELPDVLSCRDVALSVPSNLRRQEPRETSDGSTDFSHVPSWVIYWTDAAGQRWEKVSTDSDAAGDSTDLGFLYEGDASPPLPATDARLEVASVSRKLEGVKQARVWPIGYSGQCK